MAKNDNTPLSRTDTESIVRQSAYELLCIVERLQSRWAVGDPVERGNIWSEMLKSKDKLKKAIDSTPDPKPGQCAHVWFNPLDNLWDRCGLRIYHKGDHLPEYMMKDKNNG